MRALGLVRAVGAVRTPPQCVIAAMATRHSSGDAVYTGVTRTTNFGFLSCALDDFYAK